MNIPPPLPDEHVLGWRGRIGLFNHHPSAQHTMEELKSLFQHDGSENQLIVGDPSQFSLLAAACEMTPSEFAFRFSLLPYIRGFCPDIFQPEHDLGHTESIVRLYGLRTGKKGAWFCNSCVQDDLGKYGMPYWRRVHQLPAVAWCVHHGEKLFGLKSTKAFDSLPPIVPNLNKVLVPEGMDLLKDEAPIIKRYIDISVALLGRRHPMNYKKVGTLLLNRATEIAPDDGTGLKVNLNKLAEDSFPDYWKRFFLEVKGESAGKKMTNLNQIFKLAKGANDPKYYLVAFALLYNSSAQAIQLFAQSDLIEIKPVGKSINHGGVTFWNSKRVFKSYVANQGSHKKMALDLNVGREYMAHTLKSSLGLPSLGKCSRVEIEALTAFYKGKSLLDVCREHNVKTDKLERIIRQAGVRLGNALSKMC